MIYNNTLIKEINERLAERRKIAEAKAQKYTDVLNADKDYSEAFNKYNSARFDFSKAKFTGNKEAEEKASAEIGKAAEDMSIISKKLGITADMLQPDYTCKQCNDTGFLKNGKRCSCFKKLAIEKTKLWNKFSFGTRWNMRDIMRHRVLIEQVLGGHIHIISKNKFSG